LIQSLSCFSERILYFSQIFSKLPFPDRYSSTARYFTFAGYGRLCSDGRNALGPSALYRLIHRITVLWCTPARCSASHILISPAKQASTIFSFSSALWLLRLDMTTPPIEDFSNSLSSTGGAYHFTGCVWFSLLHNQVLFQAWLRLWCQHR